VITCPACGKQNQDHYRFCLGCGAELPRGAVKAPSEPPEEEIEDEETQIGGIAAADARLAEAVSVEVDGGAADDGGTNDAGGGDDGGAELTCPECEHVNPTSNRFCASCGFRLDQPDAADDDDEAPPGAAPVEPSEAILIALDPEGNEVGRFQVPAGESFVGRDTGGVFGGDTYLSPHHAQLVSAGKSLRIQDAGSLNGVFRKLMADQSEPLEPGQRFRIGQELMQYDELDADDVDDDDVELLGSPDEGYIGSLALVVGRETADPAFPVHERGVHLGRERGDVLFPEDGYVSGLHCFVGIEDGQAYVTDLGSSNGTFVQLLGEAELRNGDVLLMGQQLFRVAL
jgi:pSer/pThr/pTyr-binding forkhead associated (FHA) protein